MPVYLSRIRGLKYPIAPDEPLRKADAGSGSGGGRMAWRKLPTGGHTLVIEDSQNAVALLDATGIFLTVPTYADVPFEVGTSILIVQGGAGAVSFTGGSGVVVNCRSVFNKKTAGQHALATLVNYDTDVWLLSGDLEVAA